jgi:hypothetical protein
LGHLDIEGNYEQRSDGTLLVDVEGTQPGERDTIDITGSVELGGTLQIDGSNLSLFPDTTIDLITADSLTGTFDSVDWIGNEALRSYYYVSYDDENGIVSLSSIRDLDMNGDGDGVPLDLTDVRLFVFAVMNESKEKWWAQCPICQANDVLPQHHGDHNGNGRVDFDDMEILGSMGMPPNEITAAFDRYFNNVPEPAPAMPIAICGILLGAVHRRNGSVRR